MDRILWAAEDDDVKLLLNKNSDSDVESQDSEYGGTLLAWPEWY